MITDPEITTTELIKNILTNPRQWWILKIDIAIVIAAAASAIITECIDVATVWLFGMILFNLAVSATMFGYGFWYHHGLGEK